MAVRIDIPGIGVVEADNAAQEDTLRQILAVMRTQLRQSERKSGGDKTADKAADAIKKMTEAGEEQADTQDANTKIAKKAGVGWAAAANAMSTSLKSLGLTAANVALQMMTNFDQMAENPVDFGRDLVNTGIQIVTDFTAGLASAVPVVGGFLSALAEASGKILQAANNLFAQELKKRIDAMADFNKAGVSFAGGIDEMGKVANAAGLGIKDFTNVVKTSKEDLNMLGVTGSDAAKRLADGMINTTKMVGTSGKSLRNEMFAMGYTFEEQGQVMASYMANMQAAGKLRSMSDEEVARGTRDYAKNLKVITDITGQDAKKLMERARAESMRGALMNQLTGDQKEAFQQAHSTLMALGPEAGPKFQNALTQMLAGGAVTDPLIAGNAQAMEIIRKAAEGVKSGNTDMIAVTQSAIAQGAEAQKKLGKSSTDIAALMSNGGATTAAGFAGVENALLSYQGVVGQAAKSAKEAEDLSAVQGTTEAVANLYDATKKHQIFMENMVGEKLPEYTKLLDKTVEGMADVMQKAIRIANGEDVADVLGSKSAPAGGKGALKGAALMGGIGAAAGSFIPGVGTAIGGGIGAAVGGIGGYFGLIDYGPTAEEKPKGKAKGGISSGPLSGYQELLHGTEAVIPLPDGKKIPVDVKSPMPNADELKKAVRDGVREGMEIANQGVFGSMVGELKKQTNKLGGILNNSF